MYLTADSTVSNPVAAQPSNTAQSAAPPPPPQAAVPPQPQPPPVNQSVAVPNMAGSSTTSTVYYGQSVQQPQPQVNYPPAFYYPQPPTATAGQPQPQSTPQGYPAAMYTYSEYTSPPPAGPTQVPTMMHMIDYSLDTGNSVTGATGVTVGVNGGGHIPPPAAVSSAMPHHQVGPHGHPPVPPHHASSSHHGQQNGGGGHGVMSPSLTSGFSGSGDCKSTETSSILSAASYSSGALNNSGHSYGGGGGHYSDQYYGSKHHRNYYYHNNGGQSVSNNNYDHQAPNAWNHYEHQNHADVNYYNNNNNYVSDYHHTSPNSTGSTDASVNSESKINSNNSNQSMINSSTNSSTNAENVFWCEVCQIAFPSLAVLENHLKGSRHARRVKSQQAFRQLKDAGTLFRVRGSNTPVTDITMSGGAIRCELCQVSFNSFHQLLAHFAGKHPFKNFKIRNPVVEQLK